MWWIPLIVAPITQGIPDDADPAVVAIVRTDGTLRCSGTVIAERVVLTAAHCGVHVDPSAYRVFFGNELGTGTTIDIVEAIAHPAFDDTESHDLALVLLAEASPAPPVSTRAITTQLRLVGFGDTAGGANDGTRKREGTTIVTSMTATSVVLGADPSLPCNGDSGGPAFAGLDIAAVVSRGDPACTANGKATRVDAHLDFITPYVAATAPGTREVGERCKYDAHCTAGSCVVASDEPLLRYCSTACDGESDCSAGMDCVDDACRYREPTPGAIGSTCEMTSAVCVRGECIDAGYCSVRCVSGRDDCPDDFECSHLGGIDFFCTPVPEEDGCCDAGNGSSGAGALLLALGLYVTTERRRNSCRRRRTRPRTSS